MPISKKIFEIELSNGKRLAYQNLKGFFHAICEEELNDELYEDIKK